MAVTMAKKMTKRLSKYRSMVADMHMNGTIDSDTFERLTKTIDANPIRSIQEVSAIDRELDDIAGHALAPLDLDPVPEIPQICVDEVSSDYEPTPLADVEPDKWTVLDAPPIIETENDNLDQDASRSTDVNENRNEIEPESKSVSETAPESESSDGHLFPTCVRCLSATMIKFSSGSVPAMPTPTADTYDNAVVMTLCLMCEVEDEQLNDVDDVDKKKYASSSRAMNSFRTLKLNPALIKGSDVLKAAELIVGEPVTTMKSDSKLMFVTRDLIKSKIGVSDRMSSMNLSKVESGDASQVKLPYLSGGFF
ncbi:uncharacterized protein LTR77_011265 [Saxophila tyrrhenica]|uniref:Uncharacterized protein n=1 Tax=Saxophila tyrrhenica TaxID=1690608 RepID=A0AAV9NX05_9PEZI|nr:hypothetical protein LTR77_011265 [Saxophila tyrrhenica]